MRIWVGSGEQGAMVEPEDATISVLDHGVTVGDGVFETVKAVDGRAFLWPWHLERLHASAARLGLPLPSDAHLTRVVRQASEEWAAGEQSPGRVRLTVTAGLGPLGSDRSVAAPTVICAASAVPHRPGPARLALAPWVRSEDGPLVGAKSTSYADNVVALARAREQGADEALFRNRRGYLCEGTASNVFLVRHGRVATPPLAAGPLAGVTRRFVLGLADAGLPIVERNLTLDELFAADEVCITSSLQDVRAVAAVDGRELPLGPVVAEVQRRFAAAAAADWCWAWG